MFGLVESIVDRGRVFDCSTEGISYGFLGDAIEHHDTQACAKDISSEDKPVAGDDSLTFPSSGVESQSYAGGGHQLHDHCAGHKGCRVVILSLTHDGNSN